jgi:hypothetical protein
VSDEFTFTLCRAHLREIHLQGNEQKWWDNIKIDALAASDRLLRQTRDATTVDAPSTTGAKVA